MIVGDILKQAIWGTSLAAIGWCAFGVSSDYATERQQELHQFVPDPFKVEAARVESQLALQEGDAPLAFERARAHLVRNPFPAEGLSLFALAAGAQGTPVFDELSSRAITAAAQRGWRDPVAQIAALSSAMENGDLETAAQRLDALYRTGFEPETRLAFLQQLTDTADGREQLAIRLAAPRNWTGEFLFVGRTHLAPTVVADVIARTRVHGGAFDCDQVANAALAMLSGGHGQAARRSWSGACELATSETPTGIDFGPAAPSQVQSPFAWRYPFAAGMSHTMVTSDGRTSLRYRNDNQMRRDIALRYLTMAPGPDGFTLNTTAPSGRQASGVWLEIRCLGPDAPVIRPLAPVDQPEVKFAVPATNCAVQQVRLQSGPTDNRDMTVEITG